jgi:hypothetical protein
MAMHPVHSDSELHWTRDFSGFLADAWETLSLHPVIFGIPLAITFVSHVFPHWSLLLLSIGLASFFICCSILGFAFVQVSLKRQNPDIAEAMQSETPWAKLVLIQIVYLILSLLLALIFLVPGIWWAVRSALSFVVCCVEKKDVIPSFVRSHQLSKRYFWLACKYVAPFNVLNTVLLELAEHPVSVYNRFLRRHHEVSAALVLTSVALTALYALSLFAWLVGLGYVVRFYAYLKQREIKDTEN